MFVNITLSQQRKLNVKNTCIFSIKPSVPFVSALLFFGTNYIPLPLNRNSRLKQADYVYNKAMSRALCSTKNIDKIKVEQPLLSFSSNLKLSSYLENFVISNLVIIGLFQNFKIVYMPKNWTFAKSIYTCTYLRP